MDTPPHRKNEPDAVRAKLLTAAARIAAEQGLAAITLHAVARMAGVSKGGLLHHYPSRQHLIEALYAALLSRLDQRIRNIQANDLEPVGRFTRAYLSAVALPGESPDESRLLGAAALAMSSDLHLAETWNRWIAAHIARSGEEDRSPAAAAIRCAADGLWLADCSHTALPAAMRNSVLALLTAQTFHLAPDAP